MVRRDLGGDGRTDPVDDCVLFRRHDPARLARRAIDRRGVERLDGREVDHAGLDSGALERVRSLETPGHLVAATDQRDVGSLADYARAADSEVVVRRVDRRLIYTE